MAIRVPPREGGRLLIRDPQWQLLDRPTSDDPAEWICVLQPVEVAALLGISPRALRYWDAAGKTNFKLIGGRKRYSVSEVRRLLAIRLAGKKRPTAKERRLLILRWAKGKLENPT